MTLNVLSRRLLLICNQALFSFCLVSHFRDRLRGHRVLIKLGLRGKRKKGDQGLERARARIPHFQVPATHASSFSPFRHNEHLLLKILRFVLAICRGKMLILLGTTSTFLSFRHPATFQLLNVRKMCARSVVFMFCGFVAL